MRAFGAVVGAGLLVLAAAGCGDDGGGGDEDATSNDGDDQTTTTEEGPPVTQVAASEDPERALEQVQGVTDAGSQQVEEMFADPAAALDDPDNDLLERHRELWTPESEAPDRVEERLADFVEVGDAMVPGPSGMFDDWYLYDPSAEGDDVLAFRYCAIQDREAVEFETGEILGTNTIALAGTGEAHRVNGQWRLHRVEQTREPRELDAQELFPEFCETEAELLEQVNEGDASGEA